MNITIKVNGRQYNITPDPGWTLLDLLREGLDITSPKRGCQMGECGACTVIMDGLAVNSCIIPAMECDGKSVTTVEGIRTDGKLHPLQQAFIDKGAVQCGFCTPGMIMSAKALLDRNSNPTREEVKKAIAGNLCRCTGYIPIVDAVMEAARMIRGEEE